MKRNAKPTRAERAAAAAQIMPPEGVPLNLPIASVGVRLAAQLVDLLITVGFFVSIMIFLVTAGLTGVMTLVGVGALLFFIIRIPYYVLTELLWNGQTLGKRAMKIKVVSHMGGPLTTHALVLRNLMKEAEVFLPGTLVLTLDHSAPLASGVAFAWVCMAFAIPLLNPYRMRLGDMLAGTHVIHVPSPILLKDMASTKPMAQGDKKITFMSHQLDHYGSFELQTLEGFLRAAENRDPQNRDRDKTLAEIVKKIRNKIGYADPVVPAKHLEFLQAFYKAQRAHLEQRQLFGERRSNKHYDQKPPEDQQNT